MIRFAVLALVVSAGWPGVAAADQHGMPMANPNYSPAPPKQGYSYPDCFCTDSDGRRVELGQIACLRIGSREELARCDTSANVTTWRRLEDGCPGV